VALKEIYEDDNFSNEENKIRFEQEIAIMWGISSHPNIITLIGYSDDPRCIITKVFFFFLFPFFFFLNLKKLNNKKQNKKLYKMDLFTFIKSHSKAIPSEIIIKLASDIASGMNMMNSSGIVHRDLKSFVFFSFFFFNLILNLIQLIKIDQMYY